MHFILPLSTLFMLLIALPPAVKEKSWLRLLLSLCLSFTAVVLPVFIFLVSSLLTPDSKHDCVHGWLDCLSKGKLALTPAVLWAATALYAVEVLRVKNRTKAWIVLGVFVGATISVTCFIFVSVDIGKNSNANKLMLSLLLVPLYVAFWYSFRAVQLIRESSIGLKAYLGALFGSLPFWIASAVWSKNIYASLPETSSRCFIVTAAGRGHRKLVGPSLAIQHGERWVHANHQLITLWQFEKLWRSHAPHSHGCFRGVYNRLGPVIARQIRSPWLADAAYLAIKPVELAAKLAILVSEKSTNLEQ